VRRIVRVNSSREIVVESSGLPTRPFTGPEGQDPFWTTGIFRRDLFGSGAGIDITVTPEPPKTSDPDAIPFTTAYYFPGSDAQPADHILTIPLQMAHYTMVPDTMNIHTRNTVASQAPIGTPLSPRLTPTLPPRYHALNASILVPTQIPSRDSWHFHSFWAPSCSWFYSDTSSAPFQRVSSIPYQRNHPSGTTQSFTPNYQIPVGGQFHPGGQTQSPFGGQIPIGTQPPIGGKPPPTPPYGQNIPAALAQYWNYLIQNNPQSTGGKQPQASSFIPPSTGQPYPGPSNPIWGSNARPNVPVQGNNPNQYNPINYMPPHQQPNLPGSSHYMQTAYGPTGIPTGLPPQSHQYPHVNRQLPFLATLDLPDLSRILNDPISHSPQWPVIPAKLPSNIPKFDGKPGEDPNNHVMTFHLWCSSNSLMDDSIRLHLFQ
jgi:hypothetical protein